MGRFLMEETDENQRMRMVRASLVATGFVLVLASLWGFLEMFGLVPHVWLWAVFPAWSIGLGVGQAANRWMFGDQAGC
jgi:ABC-type multidrug transport system permease subunit